MASSTVEMFGLFSSKTEHTVAIVKGVFGFQLNYYSNWMK